MLKYYHIKVVISLKKEWLLLLNQFLRMTHTQAYTNGQKGRLVFVFEALGGVGWDLWLKEKASRMNHWPWNRQVFVQLLHQKIKSETKFYFVKFVMLKHIPADQDD